MELHKDTLFRVYNNNKTRQMTTTNLKALFTVTITTSLILTGTANAAERVEPQWLEYERSAPTLAAAREAIANLSLIHI